MDAADAAGTTWPGRAWTAANAVLFVAFLFSVVVQVNDPDPLRWILVYGLATAACLLAFVRPRHWVLPAFVAVLAGSWAGSMASRVVERAPFGDMFGAFEMESVAVEESREMYGLLIVAVWMVALTWRAVRLSRRPAARRGVRRSAPPESGER